MKNELVYFKIGNSNGGNQSWLKPLIMKLGGCAAVTACDMSIYFGLKEGKKNLYPYNIEHLHKEDYIDFAIKMKKYLKPRMGGIDTLKIYTDGFEKYLKDVGETDVLLEGFSGDESVENAKAIICKKIDSGIPIPYLLLKHKSWDFRYFKWHWFMIVGYEKSEKDFRIKVATYGNFYWLSLDDLWNTGFPKKGGMIVFEILKKVGQ